jgi:hypothetical protein
VTFSSDEHQLRGVTTQSAQSGVTEHQNYGDRGRTGPCQGAREEGRTGKCNPSHAARRRAQPLTYDACLVCANTCLSTAAPLRASGCLLDRLKTIFEADRLCVGRCVRNASAHVHARQTRVLRPQTLLPPSRPTPIRDRVAIRCCGAAVSSCPAAFVGAAGLAYALTQILNLGKPSKDLPILSSEGEMPPSARAKST